MAGTAASPIVNVPLVIKGWGDAQAKLKINGSDVPRGRDFRYGFRYGLDGADLIVWIRIESVKPIKVLNSEVK